MWQQEKKDTSIVRLILWVALATTPMAASLVVSAPMLAQSTPEATSSPLPQTGQNESIVRIDGSSSLSAINQSLKESFEKQFVGKKVEVAANGTETALKDLLDGKIDIVAMGRGLTPAEKAQGLEQVRLQREKIAIVVGADNPFKGSLTSRQFARIFRGQITNWSQLGGPSGKIRFIDRPNTSETRNTFRTYPAFKTAEFATGANATQVTDDNTAEIIKQLGKDGISYVLANQVSKLKGVRVLQLHQALPNDARYPFSQPLVYVYKKNQSLTTVDFLGFTLAPPGQQAIEKGRTAEAEAIAASVLQPAVAASPGVQTTPASTPSSNATSSVFGEQPFVAAPAQSTPIVNKETPLWLLLPVFFITVGGSVLWWILRKRPLPAQTTDNLPESNPHPPNGETAALDASTGSSLNGATLEEQAVPDFPEQETPDRTSFNIYAQNATQGTTNLVQETSNGTSNLYEGATSGVANGSENNNLGAAALGGAAIATGIGAGTWSNFSHKETETNAIDETVELNNYTETNTPDSDEVAWDIEAPAAVVNTSYPHLGNNIPEEVSDMELSSSEVTAPLPELPDVPEVTSDFGYWDTAISEDEVDEELQAELNWLESITSTEDTASVDEFPLAESDEVTADVEASATDTSSLLDLPEFPEDVLSQDALNVVADAAEPTLTLPESELPAEPTVGEDVAEDNSTDLAAAAALAAGAGIGAWASTFGSDAQNETSAAETAIGLVDADEESSIVLTPHTYTSAHVSWEISPAKKAELWQQGGTQLVVRLYDVTGIDLSYQTPQLVQQYECAETTHDRFVEIPQGDRDYIAEIGYIAYGEHWLFIARSAIVRVFSPVNPDPIVDDVPMAAATATGLVDADEASSIVLTPDTDTSAHVSWEISAAKKAALRQQGGSQLVVRLYDVTGIDLSYQTPQLVKLYESEETANEGLVDIPLSDRDYLAEIGYIADGNRWLFIARSAIVHVFGSVNPDPVVNDVAIADKTNVDLVDVQQESSIVLTPRTFQWAEVSWEISEAQKAALRQQGGSQLVVRLYDVTGIDLSYQNPQFVQQYECEETAHDRFVEIPISDRDYIAEIGYVADGGRWLFIARSAIVRIFSPVPTEPTTDSTGENVALVSETAISLANVEAETAPEESSIVLTPRTPKWAYVSWHISKAQSEALRQQGGSQLVVRLYDVTGIDLSYQSPQLVQQYESEEVARDRFVAIPVSDRDYMVEIGYIADGDAYGGKLRWLLIARSANVRVFSRPYGDFWFVADAELIIHGATQPNTNVNIGGHAIKIKPDGTFHLRLPFSDGLMDYLITVAADGESPRTIHKKFSQETSES